jgi:hypothetical protein
MEGARQGISDSLTCRGTIIRARSKTRSPGEGSHRSFNIGSPGASGGYGFESPVVPDAASALTFCALTCSTVVTDAITITTPRDYEWD